MIFNEEWINDVVKINPKYHKDDRGYFSEIYKSEHFDGLDIKPNFIQDNLSFSAKVNTVRGLHYQIEPYSQIKLVTVLKGRIWDVFVDLRKDSNSYKRYGYTELNEGGNSLLIPKGFAHGFCTLEPETLVMYKVDNNYSKDHERGIKWNDPLLNIPWPLIEESKLVISDKDKSLPGFEE